jgi:hypothetical protein
MCARKVRPAARQEAQSFRFKGEPYDGGAAESEAVPGRSSVSQRKEGIMAFLQPVPKTQVNQSTKQGSGNVSPSCRDLSSTSTSPKMQELRMKYERLLAAEKDLNVASILPAAKPDTSPNKRTG